MSIPTPRTDAYVESLPNGLDSYPECMIRVDLFEATFDELPAARDVAIIDETLRRFRSKKWMPEIYGAIINHAMRDGCFQSDEAYFEWIEEFSLRIFRRPAYRALMMLLSTQLLLMGAAKRWSSFHQGTELTVESSKERGGRRTAEAALVFPEGLYDELQVRTHCHAIRAGMVASRANNPGFQLLGIGDGRAELELTWKG